MEKKRKRGDLKKGGKRDGQYILDLPKGVVEQEENDNDNAVFQSDNNTQVMKLNNGEADDNPHGERANEEPMQQEGSSKKRRKRKKKKKLLKGNTETQSNDEIQDEGKGSRNNSTSKESVLLATLYVEGIPYSATEDDIATLFEGCTDVRMPRWHDSGRIRGYAHIDFPNEVEATNGLKRDGYMMGTRYLSVKRANEPKRLVQQAAKSRRRLPEGCRLLFVKNLPYDTTELDVRGAFKRFGAITGVRLACWNHTRNLKGFGYVEFEKSQAVEAAIRLQSEVTVGGRQVILDYETNLPKGSFRLMDGKPFAKTAAGKKRTKW